MSQLAYEQSGSLPAAAPLSVTLLPCTHLGLAQAAQVSLHGLDGLGMLGGRHPQLGHLGLQGRRCVRLRLKGGWRRAAE